MTYENRVCDVISGLHEHTEKHGHSQFYQQPADVA
jgi:hypothetical protein